jgi:hypothetical protein
LQLCNQLILPLDFDFKLFSKFLNSILEIGIDKILAVDLVFLKRFHCENLGLMLDLHQLYGCFYAFHLLRMILHYKLNGTFNIRKFLLEQVVFLDSGLNCSGKFLNGVFEELKGKFVLTFELEIDHAANGDFHLIGGDGCELIIFGSEDLLNFIKRQERIGLEKPTVSDALRLGLDEKFIVLLVEGKGEDGLLLFEDVVFVAVHERYESY